MICCKVAANSSIGGGKYPRDVKRETRTKCYVSGTCAGLGEHGKLLKQSLTTSCSHNISCLPDSTTQFKPDEIFVLENMFVV